MGVGGKPLTASASTSKTGFNLLDFRIHAIEGNLALVMPTILPAQLLPAHRKFHPDELGIKENKPPSQLSLQAIQTLQQEHMHALLAGMRFFGAGIGRAEDIPFFFLGNSAESIIYRESLPQR
jgi:hypothetical protein